MKKSLNSTVILLVVLLGLGAWYYFYEKGIKPKQAEQEEQAKTLLTLNRDDIQEIAVEQRQGDEKSTKYRSLKFKKTGTDWNMTAPVEDSAEMGALNGLITALSTTKQDRVVEEKPADLKPFGLDNPKLKIIARKDSSSAPQEIWVGNDTPVGAFVYIKIAGRDPVYRTNQTLRTSFEKEPGEYRNKKVMAITRADVSELEIQNPKGGVVLKKNGDKWLLAREGLPASENEVSKTLNALVDLRATGFAAEKPDAATLAKYGLDNPAIRATFKVKDAQALLLLGQAKDKYYAKRGDKGVIFEIPKEAFDKAARASQDYRDMKLAQFNRFNVNRIKVEHGPQSYELVKEAEKWTIGSDPTAKADTQKIEDYLSRLQDVKVKEYLKSSDKPPAPDLIVHVFEKSGSNPESETLTLKVGKPNGSKATGQRNGLERPFVLDLPDYKKINAFKQEFIASDKPAEAKAPDGKS